MRTPNGIRTESARTLLASIDVEVKTRYDRDSGVARIHRCGLYRAGGERASTAPEQLASPTMDDSLRSILGGGRA